MFIIQFSDTADFIQRLFITNMAGNCIGRIRRISNDPSLANNINRPVNQAFLRTLRMNLEILGHVVLYGN